MNCPKCCAPMRWYRVAVYRRLRAYPCFNPTNYLTVGEDISEMLIHGEEELVCLLPGQAAALSTMAECLRNRHPVDAERGVR